MRRPVWIYAVPALITGLLSAQALAAQAHVGNGKGTMTGMAKCPMMAAMTQGPDAVLSKRKTLALTAAQVDQLETLRAAETQAMKQPMDSMMALHKQLATLSEATQFDENAVRGVFDRMGAFHTAAGTAMLRAQHDARAVLTPKQREKLADGVGTMGTMNKSSMNKSSMNKSSMNKSGMNKSGMNKSGMNKSGMNKSGTAGKGMTHGDTAKPASSAGAGTAATSARVPVPGRWSK